MGTGLSFRMFEELGTGRDGAVLGIVRLKMILLCEFHLDLKTPL